MKDMTHSFQMLQCKSDFLAKIPKGTKSRPLFRCLQDIGQAREQDAETLLKSGILDDNGYIPEKFSTLFFDLNWLRSIH